MNTQNIPKCPCCDEGFLKTVQRDYMAAVADDQKVRVRDLQMEVCTKCGEEILPMDSVRKVESAIAEYTDRFSSEDVRELRNQYSEDQTEMAEILGLGAKTYHNWEKGTRYPSRSMGFYLRILNNFPEVFAWLRSRGWKGRNRVFSNEQPQLSLGRRFPELACQPERLNQLVASRQNPARILFDTK